MRPRWPRFDAACQRLARRALHLLALGFFAGGPALADHETHRFNGSFWGLQLHSGVSWVSEPEANPGPTLGVSARFASLMSLLDVQASFLWSRYIFDEETPDGPTETDVTRYSLGGSIQLHPLFMRHLGNDRFSYTLAALYLSIGLDFDIIDSDEATATGAGLHIGGGTDIPLWQDDADGWGFWIGLNYRHRFLSASPAIAGVSDFGEHTILISLAYRHHGILFARLPRPEELNDLTPVSAAPARR